MTRALRNLIQRIETLLREDEGVLPALQKILEDRGFLVFSKPDGRDTKTRYVGQEGYALVDKAHYEAVLAENETLKTELRSMDEDFRVTRQEAREALSEGARFP